ncbi:SufD family Fe-S cluster assembly protein [Iamia sp. SCSIO 61187]|uniref:SufB/SufD family protein n=1 Tax=Iamia sp. SCSIO 61187 TaxID=2722752 RepID=UPI001C62D7F6|nr:SufD family Fe-S cluster assembly protein [Iamia sp. SCSIO 61187]QYG93813.1 SufD family Fe-S cluster assembly protein [Iamia sp. SCSIO 61187]
MSPPGGHTKPEIPLSPTPDDLARLPGDTATRAAAAGRAEAAGLPSTDAEEWRYSRIDELDLGRYAPVLAAPDHDPGAPPALPDAEGPWSAEITVVDGWVRAVEVRDEALTVDTGDDAALGSVLGEAHDAMAEWSIALAPMPVTIRVRGGAHVAAPILIRTVGATADALSAPRILVVAAEGAAASVVEHQTSLAGDRLVLPLVELDVAARARLAYTTTQEHAEGTWQMANVVARVAQEGSLVAAAVALGGDYTRLRTDCRLDGRGASGDLLAAYFGEGDQTLDFRTFQDHRAPDTTSDLLFKGAVGGRSRSIYTGLITVRPEGRGTNAFQTNRNLKLSEEAWAESVPNLEIQNNDVHCSHASTVGPIDEDQRFYLESRGVPPHVAERLVVSGFFGDVLDRMPAPASVLTAIRAAVDARLDRQVLVGEEVGS